MRSGTFLTCSAEETFELGYEIGESLTGRTVFLLDGELGAGKTVFVRGLALGEVDWKSGWRPILKEGLVGFGNGAANGLLTAAIVGFWTGDWILAAILFSAMIFNLIIAGIAGGLVPLVLEKLGYDPAIASSIFRCYSMKHWPARRPFGKRDC